MLYGTVTFEDITLEWMASFLPSVTQTEQELGERRAILIGTGDPSGLPRDEVRFEGVRFAYPGTDQEVFSGLDLAITANRSMAIVGANGAGKTTLVKLLARLHEPTAGGIFVDGIDIASLKPDEWQRRIAVVFQDFARFPLPTSASVPI